ncbi:MAG: restriction endonuclease subunit S [Oscillibacter sp.]|nr:restriction endonuclease subunit S [Oscillibacter sp.]MBQ9617691.1 restriction endonuclease subunit S [Oscillibacter sp.]
MLEKKTRPGFVPEAEQPYKIPQNWRWVRLGAVCDFIGGGTPSKKSPEYWNGSIPWASVKDIKGTYLTDTIDTITETGLQNSAANLCDIGDLLLITRIEPAKTVIAKIVTAINQDLKIVKSPLSSLFLHYYFRAFQQSFLDMASGSTVLGITIANVENAAIPLPPLAEQQRIIDRIEGLFTKLDKARENIVSVSGHNDTKNTVLGKIDIMKRVILGRAFRGELGTNRPGEPPCDIVRTETEGDSI